MIVTYTNHALNQFLQFIKNYTQKIVKIGGRFEEGLEKFGWREKFKNANLGQNFYTQYRKIKTLNQKIDEQKKELLKYEFRCINTIIAEENNAMGRNIKEII